MRDEFVNGMKKFGLIVEVLVSLTPLRAANVEDIRQKLASLDPGFLERNEFKGVFIIDVSFMSAEFYRFVFQFSREGTHKTIGGGLPIPELTCLLFVLREGNYL